MVAEVSSIKDLTKSLKTYMDSDQLEQVKKAFFFAANAHSGQYRVSGDPYVTHPVCLLYTSPSPRDRLKSRMPSSA